MTDEELNQCLEYCGVMLVKGRYAVHDLLVEMFASILEIHQREYHGAKLSCDKIYSETFNSRRKLQSQYFANAIKSLETIKKRLKQTYSRSEIVERFVQNMKKYESEGNSNVA